MGSADDRFEAKQAPAGSAGDKPTVTWWITQKDKGRLFIDQQNDGISVNIAELEEKVPVIKVIGEIKKLSESSGETCVGYPWDWSSTENVVNNFVPPDNQPDAVDRIAIRLEGIETAEELDATVQVTLTVQATEYILDLPFKLSAEPPKITKFRANPSIVVIGKKITLQGECNNASSYEIKDDSGHLVAAKKDLNPTLTVREEKQFGMNESGRVCYELIARNSAGAEQRVAVPVRVLGASGWVSAPRWWDDGQVAGLCASADGETLYALVRSGSAASVWGSADGFSRWEQLAKVPDEMITTAPGVGLNLMSGPTLVLAGGSKVDYEQVSNDVWLFDVTKREWSSAKADWVPRMGHACVVALDGDGYRKVWVIGGLDKAGNALRDAWASADGQHWEPRQMPQGWKGRCLFGAAAQAVKEGGKGSEIWMGGGFDGPDGNALDDLWAWNSKTQAGTKHLERMTDDPFMLSGVALVVLDGEVYVAVGERKENQAKSVTYQTIFGRVKKERGSLVKPAASRREDWLLEWPESRIEAVAFNGCIWLFSLRLDKEHNQIKSSPLYYWVPTPT